MISFPHAKINLGLSIISKRPDGFHNLETIFYPLPVRDVLEIVPSGETRIITTGLTIPGVVGDNLVMRAYQLLKTDYPAIGPLDIFLHKAIPMGSGLGGGSSDGAAMLQLMNRYFNLGIYPGDLCHYALKLGSDCPFFMQSFPSMATERGEKLEPVAVDLTSYSFLLIHPEIRIETAWAFSKIKPAAPRADLRNDILKPVETWSENIKNVFEIPVFTIYPRLKQIKEKLYGSGALYASLTGSGSTVYGIFQKGAIPDSGFENLKQTYIF
jgi:4-diphosphocytidyl-2-C-methyl-D-erythritol kinase